MKKYMFIILLGLITVSVFISCSDMNDMHDKYLRDGERVYIGRVDSVQTFGGNERILIKYWITDPRAKSLHILWNQKQDSMVIPIPKHDPVDALEVLIGDGKVTEGDHTFFFYSYGDIGYRSVVFETLLSIYGSSYQAMLMNRSVKGTTKSGDNELTITWGGGSRNDELGLFLFFADPDGQQQRLFIELEKLGEPVVVSDIDYTQPIHFQSLFLPEPEAIDTFAVELEQIIVKEQRKRINVALGRNVTASDALNDNLKASNAVDGITNEHASRWVSIANNGEHWIEVDLGQEYAVDGFKTYVGSGGNFSHPMDKFEFQALVDGEWVTIVSETGNTDPQYGKDFEEEVLTSKVRYYVPAYENNQVRLYELEVYSTITY